METSLFTQEFKKRSADLSKFMEIEFLKLKYKVALCAHNCFDRESFLEAISCEKECTSSVETAFVTMKNLQKMMASRMDQCKKDADEGLEGLNGKIDEAAAGHELCYQQYYQDLESMKKEMEKEFSYYY
jgi:hypothetical protein